MFFLLPGVGEFIWEMLSGHPALPLETVGLPGTVGAASALRKSPAGTDMAKDKAPVLVIEQRNSFVGCFVSITLRRVFTTPFSRHMS